MSDFDVLGGAGDIFDFNRDGRLDGAEFGIAMEILSEDDPNEYEDDEDDELEEVGLDRFDLDLMDVDERREALEDAGLDPDDYEELFQ